MNRNRLIGLEARPERPQLLRDRREDRRREQLPGDGERRNEALGEVADRAGAGGRRLVRKDADRLGEARLRRELKNELKNG